jgi:hypothetical protein
MLVSDPRNIPGSLPGSGPGAGDGGERYRCCNPPASAGRVSYPRGDLGLGPCQSRALPQSRRKLAYDPLAAPVSTFAFMGERPSRNALASSAYLDAADQREQGKSGLN